LKIHEQESSDLYSTHASSLLICQ